MLLNILMLVMSYEPSSHVISYHEPKLFCVCFLECTFRAIEVPLTYLTLLVSHTNPNLTVLVVNSSCPDVLAPAFVVVFVSSHQDVTHEWRRPAKDCCWVLES